MDKIHYSQIRERIKATALEKIPAFPKGRYDAWDSFQKECDDIKDSAYEIAREEVEYWDWSVYTYQGFLVYDALSSSEQDDAEQLYYDLGASECEPTPYSLGAAMATLWLIQEVSEEIESLCEEFMEMAESEMENL